MKARTGNNQNPTTLWKHLEEIINTHIRPLLQDHGGDVVIREVRGKDVRVALLGNCKGCPAAQITIEQTVQRILVEKMGDQIGKVILVNEIDPSILDFARHLSDRGIDVWIRHVLVPGVTDDDESLTRLGKFIGGIKTLRAIDVLPYHTMGIVKYENLGLPYRLKDVPAATKAQAKAARDVIFAGVKQRIAEDIAKAKAENAQKTE